jgi:hypothetical protein
MKGFRLLFRICHYRSICNPGVDEASSPHAPSCVVAVGLRSDGDSGPGMTI